jgi:hypothetical protein
MMRKSAAEGGSSMHPRFQATQRPEHPAVIMAESGATLTYRELESRANQGGAHPESIDAFWDESGSRQPSDGFAEPGACRQRFAARMRVQFWLGTATDGLHCANSLIDLWLRPPQSSVLVLEEQHEPSV